MAFKMLDLSFLNRLLDLWRYNTDQLEVSMFPKHKKYEDKLRQNYEYNRDEKYKKRNSLSITGVANQSIVSQIVYLRIYQLNYLGLFYSFLYIKQYLEIYWQ